MTYAKKNIEVKLDANMNLIASSVPIVGIGASAGGLVAFEAFFSGMPIGAELGIAVVIVQHLSPDHKSLLTSLIQRHTIMKVIEVEDGVKVLANHVYIIPPGSDMALIHGRLQLLKFSTPRGQRLPIDFFFRSLAQDLRERAICVILSGTGSDGTLGLRMIKGEGGMVIAQNPESTEYDGMPRSAIATGLVDYELPPEKMAEQIISYIAHAFVSDKHIFSKSGDNSEQLLDKIFLLLRNRTGNDFSQYKQKTIYRRIERRMAVHQIESIQMYVQYLQKSPAEVDALFHDLLIGVTNFFRDPEAFYSLEQLIIPKIFEGKPEGSQIRVWSPGCSTGEEAYSIAILLKEYLNKIRKNYQVQIFATDIDRQAIETARGGLFSVSISADISQERLDHFFIMDPSGSNYRIHKDIRDMLIFSEHNLIKDPPFSKLDLISCRNLMIYMNSDLQKKIIPLFHYALNLDGILFLGTSETVGDFHSLFEPIDRVSKIYERKEYRMTGYSGASNRVVPSMATTKTIYSNADIKPAVAGKLPLRELTEQALLDQVSPVAALVNVQGNILYLHGKTGMYLEPAPGEVGVSNILAMAREGLRRELTVALHKSILKKAVVTSPSVRVKINGLFTTVKFIIRPVETGFPTINDSVLYLVIMEDDSNLNIEQWQKIALDTIAKTSYSEVLEDPRIEALKQELRANEEYLQTSNDALETSNEELKSANEEMQSINEELQSTNEELETSKEELQSVNEELGIVNGELQDKVADLSHLNNDMNNLLAGTGIATIFVNHKLHILRFTPAMSKIINLIPSDIFRPVGHIVSNLIGYSNLLVDIQLVLDTLSPKEIEVQTIDKFWYLMRIQPYRTLENVIEGAVISFIDISEIVKIRESLQKSNDLLRLSIVVHDSRDAITVHDLEGTILAWNPAAVKIYGWTEAEALKMSVQNCIPESRKIEELEMLKKLAHLESFEPYETQRIAKDGSVINVVLTASALIDKDGHSYAVATTERISDLTQSIK